jgi:hypothetical protein
MRTRAILIVAALCLATPANAKSWMRWDCGDDVTVTLGVSAPHQNALKREIHSIEIDGLRDPVKDHVIFKLVPTQDDYPVPCAYLNGKRCLETP